MLRHDVMLLRPTSHASQGIRFGAVSKSKGLGCLAHFSFAGPGLTIGASQCLGGVMTSLSELA